MKTRHAIQHHLGYFLSTFLLLGCGLSLILGSEVKTLKCDRLKPNLVTCKLISSNLLFKTSRPIPRLHGAINYNVNYYYEYEDSYKIMLLTGNQKIPMTRVPQSMNFILYKMNEKVKRINYFVDNPSETSLTVREGYRWIKYPVGALFLLMGVGVIRDLWFGGTTRRR